MALTTRESGLGQKNNDCWLPTNVSVSGGALQLTTRREPTTCVKNDGTTFEATHTSGSVSTYRKFDQAFGRWEIRARFPQATVPGAQGALWLWPSTTVGTWPGSGEIDIAEFYSQYPDRAIPYLHYVSATSDPTVTNNYCMVNKPSEFHTYVLEWFPGRIKITFDGKTCIDHTIDPALPLTGSAPFDKPYFINLSQMLGQGGNAPSEATPAVMTTEVDWVRVWS